MAAPPCAEDPEAAATPVCGPGPMAGGCSRQAPDSRGSSGVVTSGMFRALRVSGMSDPAGTRSGAPSSADWYGTDFAQPQ